MIFFNVADLNIPVKKQRLKVDKKLTGLKTFGWAWGKNGMWRHFLHRTKGLKGKNGVGSILA